MANSPVTYNGSAQAATVNGSVAGTVSNVKYNGSGTVPVAANTYAVTADFTPENTTDYASLSGAAAGSLVIGQAPLSPAVTLNDKVYDGTTAAATIATRELSGDL